MGRTVIVFAMMSSLLAGSRVAVAEGAGGGLPELTGPLAPSQAQSAMHDYFAGEKRSASPWLATGVVASGGAAWLLTRGAALENGELQRWAAGPLLGVGIIQLAAGIALLARTSGRVADLDQLYRSDPERFLRAERERIARVNRTFDVLLGTELVLIAGGTVMAVAGARTHTSSVEGLGLGVGGQGAAMFMLDLFASLRSREYARSLANPAGLEGAPVNPAHN